MAKPVNIAKERNIFNEIDLQIMLVNEQIKNHMRSIEKAKRMSGWQGPAGVSGMDYSHEPGSGTHISFAEGLRMIELDEKRIWDLVQERTELRRSKKRIEKIHESLCGMKERIYYFRVICKMTQAETAAEISISERQLQRIEAKMKSQGLM